MTTDPLVLAEVLYLCVGWPVSRAIFMLRKEEFTFGSAILMFPGGLELVILTSPILLILNTIVD